MRNVFVQRGDAPQTQRSDPDQIANVPKCRCAQRKIFNLASGPRLGRIALETVNFPAAATPFRCQGILLQQRLMLTFFLG